MIKDEFHLCQSPARERQRLEVLDSLSRLCGAGQAGLSALELARALGVPVGQGECA